MIILKHDEIVSKVFNNNIVLVNSDEKEKILFAKGIGFGKKQGNIIEKGYKIEKIFTIEDSENKTNFNSVLDRVDEEFFAVCEEAIYEVAKKVNQDLNESIHIGLIDHLFFAIKRIQNKEIIENPFLIEIETLYSKEFRLAKMVADRVGKYSDIDIPDDEVGFIALHIHSAINNSSLSNALKNNYLGSVVAEHIEERLNVKINKKSLDYARFLTHLRFAVQRILEDRKVDNKLDEVIKNTYKESYEIAEEVADIIGKELKVKVKEDEITFLTIHIERFRISLKY